MISLRLAWREIQNGRKFSLFFIFNLALGLLGFFVLDAFKSGLDRHLAERSRDLLSADLSVSARRELTPEEARIISSIIPQGTREGRLVEMYSMVASEKTSRLVEVVSTDSNYPFYGQMQLKEQGTKRGGDPRDIDTGPVAWIYPELEYQLGVKPGDTLKIGNAQFKIRDIILNDSGNAWRGFTLSSRIYIGLPSLDQTGLIQKGSTAFIYRLYRFPDGTDIEAIAKKLNQGIQDASVRITTHKNASEEVGRMLGYLNDYLGLVALVALFLAAIGSSYLFRAFIARRMREIAVLASLGVTPREIRRIYLTQLSILGAASSILTIGAGIAVLPLARWAVEAALGATIQLKPELRTITVTLAVGTLGSVLICLPLLLRLRELKPNLLFQESADPTWGISKSHWLGFLPGLAAFWAMAIWQSHSLKVGSLFMGAFLGSGALLAGMAALLLSGIRALEPRLGFSGRLALRNLRRSPVGSISCFVAIGLGALLLNLIPELRANIDSEFTAPDSGQTPSLFLFDVQEDQVQGVRDYLKKQDVPLLNLSPLIRSRLLGINGKPFEKSAEKDGFKTREEEQEARSRNRGFNLSYRAGLSETESLYDGRPLADKWDGKSPAELSVERRFAERLGIHIGDILDFDVQGIPIQGKVVNLRKVKWASFQPNFFILVQPGVLDDAPKTYIASIPKLSFERKASVQNGIVAEFPNVSMYDIDELVKKILDIFRQMGWAIQVMAYLSLFAGLIVLFSIANHQAATRGQETNLLKVLGARFSEIQRMIQIEFGILAALAALFGTALSYGVSYLISVVLFDGVWVFSWQVPLASVIVISSISVITAMAATASVLKRKPIELLQSGT